MPLNKERKKQETNITMIMKYIKITNVVDFSQFLAIRKKEMRTLIPNGLSMMTL